MNKTAPSRFCPSCGAELTEGARFCRICGKEVGARVCQNCGAKIIESDCFCRNCGEKVVSTLPQEKEPQITKVSPKKRPKMRWQYRLAIVVAVFVFLGITIPILAGRENPTIPVSSFQDMARLLLSKVDIPEDSRVYGVLDPFPGGADISIQPDVGDVITFRASQPTYFFFIDDEPLMRFAHPVRYVLLEASGQDHVYLNEWLPVVNGQDWEIHEEIEVQGVPVTVLRESGQVQGFSPSGSKSLNDLFAFALEHLLPPQEVYAQSSSGKIAIILDGSEPQKDYREEVAQQFADDADHTEFILSMQGYDTVRYSGYNGNVTPSISRAGLEKEITRIANETRSGDEVTIYLGGHGLKGGFAMYNKEGKLSFINYAQLADWVKKIDSGVKIRLIIDACYSGGAKPHFADMPNVVVYTATDDKSTTPVGLGENMSYSKYIMEGYNSEAADENQDGEQDIDECCRYASQRNKAEKQEEKKQEEKKQEAEKQNVWIFPPSTTVEIGSSLFLNFPVLKANVGLKGATSDKYEVKWLIDGKETPFTEYSLTREQILSIIGKEAGPHTVSVTVWDKATGEKLGSGEATVIAEGEEEFIPVVSHWVSTTPGKGYIYRQEGGWFGSMPYPEIIDEYDVDLRIVGSTGSMTLTPRRVTDMSPWAYEPTVFAIKEWKNDGKFVEFIAECSALVYEGMVVRPAGSGKYDFIVTPDGKLTHFEHSPPTEFAPWGWDDIWDLMPAP